MRALWTEEDCIAVCSYILRKLDAGQEYFLAGSKFTWKTAIAEGLMHEKKATTAQMHSLFHLRIKPKLHLYVKDPADQERLRRCLLYTDRRTIKNNAALKDVKQEAVDIFDTPTSSCIVKSIARKRKLNENGRKIEKFLKSPKKRQRLSRYSDEELREMTEFFLKTLRRQSLKADFERINSFQIKQIWKTAREQGLFSNRTDRALDFTFRHKILPNLQKYVKNSDDADFVRSNLEKANFRRAVKKEEPDSDDDNLQVLINRTVKEDQKASTTPGSVYSQKESKSICSYILSKLDSGQQYFYPGSQKAWMQAAAEGLLSNRHPKAVAHHFSKRVMPNLERYVKDPNDLQRLQACFRYVKKTVKTGTANAAGLIKKKVLKSPKKFRAAERTAKASARYADSELTDICQFVVEKLRKGFDDGQIQLVFDSRLSVGGKIWRSAHAEGLFINRTINALHQTFNKLLLPNLHKFVADPNDQDLIRSNFCQGAQNLHTTSGRKKAKNSQIKSDQPIIIHRQPIKIERKGEDVIEETNIFDENAVKKPMKPIESISRQPIIMLSSCKTGQKNDPHPSKASSSSFIATPSRSDIVAPDEKQRHHQLETENVQLKRALEVERKEKSSNYRLIENLSRQLDYHERETVKRQKESYHYRSRSIELENENLLLKFQLSKYAADRVISPKMT